MKSSKIGIIDKTAAEKRHKKWHKTRKRVTKNGDRSSFLSPKVSLYADL